jgi:hypothetical protein
VPAAVADNGCERDRRKPERDDVPVTVAARGWGIPGSTMTPVAVEVAVTDPARGWVRMRRSAVTVDVPDMVPANG